MTRLALATHPAGVPAGADETFLWDGTANDSFRSSLSPSLAGLGPVPALNADFVRIALAVFSSDHSVLRQAGGSNWNARELDLEVPVSDPALWRTIAAELAETIAFLTGDHWSFAFQQLPPQTIQAGLVPDASARVVLFSGGADSGTGALMSAGDLAPGAVQTLLSHASSSSARTPQAALAGKLEAAAPGKQAAHHRVFLNRSSARLDGSPFPVEPSSRSRSLLFLALGLAVAAQSGSPLWIPENGFASLNPPLGPERLGALSTKTTQPWFLWKLSGVLATVGAHALIENPFQNLTKGEMFAQVVVRHGEPAAADYLSATNSCSHTDQRFQGVPSGTHCGVCFGCIVRRASFTAASVTDRTRYLSDEPPFAAYVASHSIVDAVRDFVATPISDATIMSMPLPPSLSPREAMALCERGQAEIGQYLS